VLADELGAALKQEREADRGAANHRGHADRGALHALERAAQ
jgi:hypothetical protein